MDRTIRSKGGQAAPVENLRGEHFYVRTPQLLRRLPASVRVSAIEVWVALYSDLGVQGDYVRVTDECLSRSPDLSDRKPAYIRKGLRTLSRVGLIEVRAKGSRRDVRIVAKLAGTNQHHFADINKKVDIRPRDPYRKPAVIDEPPLAPGTVFAFLQKQIPGYKLPATVVTANSNRGDG
jgi:hypothetical protein